MCMKPSPLFLRFRQIDDAPCRRNINIHGLAVARAVCSKRSPTAFTDVMPAAAPLEVCTNSMSSRNNNVSASPCFCLTSTDEVNPENPAFLSSTAGENELDMCSRSMLCQPHPGKLRATHLCLLQGESRAKSLMTPNTKRISPSLPAVAMSCSFAGPTMCDPARVPLSV
jgi:hypothetical protein